MKRPLTISDVSVLSVVSVTESGKLWSKLWSKRVFGQKKSSYFLTIQGFLGWRRRRDLNYLYRGLWCKIMLSNSFIYKVFSCPIDYHVIPCYQKIMVKIMVKLWSALRPISESVRIRRIERIKHLILPKRLAPIGVKKGQLVRLAAALW